MKGGKRSGAGRKPTPDDEKRIRVTVRLPQWLANWLHKKGDQGKTIENALIEKYKLKK